MSVRKLNLLLCVIAFSVLPQITFGQSLVVDQVIDFEDLSLNGFINGAAPGPFVTADATGNNALEIVTNGNPAGGGSGVLVFNNDFVGDLTGVDSVQFDVINPNVTDLNFRFSFGDPSNVFVSNDLLATAGSTSNLTFGLNPSNFVQAVGVDPFSQALSNVDQSRFLANPIVATGGGANRAIGAPILDLAGNPVAGSVFIDNLVFNSAPGAAAPAAAPAAAVPEPSSVSLLLGLAGLMATGRRRKI